MTKTVLIVGSGPAAAAAALACTRHGDVRVTIIDVGERLEQSHERARQRLATVSHDAWLDDDLRLISSQPRATSVKGPPQKRAYGSDFPFRDVGQRHGVTGEAGANDALISPAYGGFSTVWGAQVMPFSSASFAHWPVTASEMYMHYGHVLREIPFAAVEDDLATLFPLLAPATPLPPLSERTDSVLRRYERHRRRINRRGVTLGRARLAFDAANCVRCGLCMTGCPYSLIYSASQTIDRLRRAEGLTYHSGLLAIHVEEDQNEAVVIARETATGRLQRFSADRVFLACGAFGTTRLVVGSLGLLNQDVQLQESLQFLVPFASSIPTRHDPRTCHDFTLNQFNMVVQLDDVGLDVAQLHFYTYNPSLAEQLPRLVRGRAGAAVTSQMLRRLTVAFGYLPSWASPPLTARAEAPLRPNDLPRLRVTGQTTNLRNAMLRSVIARVTRVAPHLDLWPVLPLMTISAPAKSYHWGGSFAHADHAVTQFQSDVFGCVSPWTRIHLVDGATLPSVPATTFTLTVMANAHRIASSTLSRLP